MSKKTTAEVLTGAPDKSDVAGYAFFGPMTATRPTSGLDATAVKTNYKGLGFITEDGVTITTDTDTEKVYDWGGDVIAILNNSSAATLTFTIAQRSADGMRYVFGDNAVKTTGTGDAERVTRIDLTMEVQPHRRLAFLLAGAFDASGNSVPEILDIGDSQVTSVGDITYSRTGIASYPVTVELFKVNGAFASHHVGAAAV